MIAAITGDNPAVKPGQIEKLRDFRVIVKRFSKTIKPKQFTTPFFKLSSQFVNFRQTFFFLPPILEI